MAKVKILENHKNILEDICLKLKNCADCYNEETEKTECCPLCRLDAELHDMTADTFFMEPYNSKTHTEFAEIASKHGYEMTIVGEKGEELIKFQRKKYQEGGHTMYQIKQSEWDKIPNDYKGVWHDYHNECPELLGKRVVMSGCITKDPKELGKLLVEDVHFVIVP